MTTPLHVEFGGQNGGSAGSSLDTRNATLIYIAVSRNTYGGAITLSNTAGDSFGSPIFSRVDTNNVTLEVFKKSSPAGNAADVFQIAGTDIRAKVHVIVFFGDHTDGVLQNDAAGVVSANGGNSTTRAIATTTPAVANSLVVSACATEAAGETLSNDQSFTESAESPSSIPNNYGPIATAYKTGMPASAINLTWTVTGAGGYNVAGNLVFGPPSAPATSAAVTGTGAAGVTGVQVRTDGTKTLIYTLTGDTFSSTNTAAKQAIIDSWAAGSSPTWGWNNNRSLIPTSAVVFTGSNIATLTIPAIPSYQADANETLTGTIPGSILTGGVAIVAAPTVTISRTVTDLTPVAGYIMRGTATRSP